MPTSGINAANAYAGANAASKATQQNATTKKAGSELNVDDFLKLLASQLQNQDMMNPMKDSEFMGQLAQFTMLQQVNDMKEYITASTEVSATAYTMSLVGKTVTAATVDDEGNVKKITGEVTGVTFYEGQPVFYIDGKGFYLSQLMVVGDVPEDPIEGETPEEKPDEKPEQI